MANFLLEDVISLDGYKYTINLVHLVSIAEYPSGDQVALMMISGQQILVNKERGSFIRTKWIAEEEWELENDNAKRASG